MATHWDSSRKPLYLRTVFRDGQRHVLLDCAANPPPSPNGSVRSSSHPPENLSERKKIAGSSAKLVLAGVRSFGSKREPQQQQQPTKALKSAGSGKIDRATTEKRSIPAALSIKSKSIDVACGPKVKMENRKEDWNVMDSLSPCFAYQNYLDPRKDSLSDRVLIWLDLAAQSGNRHDGAIKGRDSSMRRIQTAVVAKNKCFEGFKAGVKVDGAFKIERVRQFQSRSRDLTFARKQKSCEFDDCFDGSLMDELRLSSKVEDVFFEDVKEVQDKKCMEKRRLVKRQLHIFMPNLPKKFSDCDSGSVLSSKISSKI